MITLVGSLARQEWALVVLGVTAVVNAICYTAIQVVRALAPQESSDRRGVWIALKEAFMAWLSHRRWLRDHRMHGSFRQMWHASQRQDV